MSCLPCAALAGPRRRYGVGDHLANAAGAILGQDPSTLVRREVVGRSTGETFAWYGCPT